MMRWNCLLLIAIALLAAPLQAQQYKAKRASITSPDLLDQETGGVDMQKVNKLKVTKQQILSNSIAWDDNAKSTLYLWYNGYLFRTLTLAEHESELPEIREDVLRDLRMVKQEETRNYVLNLTLNNMSSIANDTFSPAARVNAMLIIASLNSEERSVQNPAPTPYGLALKPLRDALKSPTQLDGVRLAALMGILRHAESQWADKHTPLSAAGRDVLIQDMLEIVRQQEPPAERSAAGHDWMRSRAVDVLAALNHPGANNEVLQTLEQIVANQEASLLLRCRAARALGRFDYEGENVKGDRSDAVRSLAGLAAQACRTEVARLEQLKKIAEERKALATTAGAGTFGGAAAPVGAGFGDGMMRSDPGIAGGAPGMMAPPPDDMEGGGGAFTPFGGMAKKKVIEPFHEDLSRRLVRSQMMCIDAGLRGTHATRKGLTSTVEDAKGKQIATFTAAALDKLFELTAAEEAPDFDALIEGYTEAADRLEPLAARAAAAPAAPAEPAGGADDIPGASDIPAAVGANDIPAAAPAAGN